MSISLIDYAVSHSVYKRLLIEGLVIYCSATGSLCMISFNNEDSDRDFLSITYVVRGRKYGTAGENRTSYSAVIDLGGQTS